MNVWCDLTLVSVAFHTKLTLNYKFKLFYVYSQFFYALNVKGFIWKDEN